MPTEGMPDARPWMQDTTPQDMVPAVDYLLAFLFQIDGPMPEPDAKLAEQALSLICGMYSGHRFDGNPSRMRAELVRLRKSLAEGQVQRPGRN